MALRDLTYHRPRSLDEAHRLMAAQPRARWIAGGTDLMIRLKDTLPRGCGLDVSASPPSALISLRGVRELRGVELSSAGTRIGAVTPTSDLLDHPELRARYPALTQALCVLGGPQVRSAATIGGNLCNASPCADTAPPLLVHEARVELSGPEGSREALLEDFFTAPGQTRLAPGELLARVHLPPPPTGARALFLKKTRVAMDLALASVAALVVMEAETCVRVRVAAGAVAPTPLRLRQTEAALEGGALTDARIARGAAIAAEEIRPISDIRASADYRRAVVEVFVKRALTTLRSAPAGRAT